ncbi:MAG: helix-turn-helix transcriptional regulator [Burkholderiaceae bacterium]|nr:helix-turn-helix transcriptional regulator [Burkholderiaceae bacterium]
MKKEITETIYAEIAAFVTKGIDSWLEAGKLIKDLVDDHGISQEEIAERAGLPPVVVGKLEMLGRERIMPQLLLATYPAATFLPRLDCSLQKAVLANGVDVLLENGETLRISAPNLTRLQCQQVFDRDGVRTPAAQKAWIESEALRLGLSRVPEVSTTYQIRKGKVFIPAPCHLTQKDLVRMLGELSA